jgi:hypothetical protein
VLDRLTLATAHHRSSFICRTTGRACALVTERAVITAYDPEDKADRRVGGLLHEPCTPRDEEMGVQNSSTTAEHNSTRKIFAVFQTDPGGYHEGYRSPRDVISRKDGRNGGVGDCVRFTPKSGHWNWVS